VSPLAPDRHQDPDPPEDGPAAPGRVYSLQSVDRVCRILDLLQETVDGVTLVDVARATNLPKSSAFRYLWTLEEHRYVERDAESGLYQLGLGFVGMQSRHLEMLRARAHPWLEKLRDDLGETTNLGVLDGNSVIYVDIVESRKSVRLAASRGSHDALHSTSLGKAIAAHLDEDRVRELLTHAGMPQRTPNTITTVDDYLVELNRVRRIGYAVDDGENEIDGRCVAVPILGTRLPAALSLSAPASRFPQQQVESVAKELRLIAEQIAT
jgi:IclR family acetate operon transcriptional repressor